MTETCSTDYGVLLYYKYVDIPDTCRVRDWLHSLCHRLALVGRVRISPQGINATVRTHSL